MLQDRLNAIKSVCNKRLQNGATLESIKEYLSGLASREKNQNTSKMILDLKNNITTSTVTIPVINFCK
ncbi:hypothetical protein CIG1485E_a0095 (plasmid) [Campylobacter iguaniorum]|uniref:Uncharacterized protein n=1 Tax=Campylobacter iguaniorum TaxID=1244531 RepID=A0A076FBL7_9BACT|nr:hypothetical protein [Campylobacter iguaniorum]AII15620.1 hypothetical protein CIG1485E_a0095 [Campylobacter iguaniorum]